MKKTFHIIAALLCLAPVVYLLAIYSHLPERVPTRFDLNGTPTVYQTRDFFAMLVSGLAVFSGLLYLFIYNAWRIDPKKKAFENRERLHKIAFSVVAFMAIIQAFLIYSSQTGRFQKDPKLIFVLTGIFFAVIGNYMRNLKPNYFAGFRLPWTLESEDNWRKTHHLASKLWFAGGLLMALFTAILPFTPAMIAFFTIAFVIAVIPIIYSYRLFKATKRSAHGL